MKLEIHVKRGERDDEIKNIKQRFSIINPYTAMNHFSIVDSKHVLMITKYQRISDKKIIPLHIM
jgi:hypothetical protein